MPLKIHVIGGSKGESIVLQLPDETWGVIDCYSRSRRDPSKNAALQFLLNENVEHLSFICMTHAHEDHFLGIRQLMDEFSFDQFWHPAVLSVDQLRNYLFQAAFADGEEDEDETGSKNKAEELALLWREIDDLERSKKIVVQRVTLGQNCVAAALDRGFTIEGVGPSAKQSTRFEKLLRHCFDEEGVLVEKLSHRSVNYSSIGLLISYGQNRILLGGDIEDKGWEDLLNQRPDLATSTNFVKVSHHGSTNSYCGGLWDAHSRDLAEKPVAVLTPYKRFKLPKLKFLSHIRGYGSPLYSAGLVNLDTPNSNNPITSMVLLQRGTFSDDSEEGSVTVVFDENGIVSEPTCSDPAFQIF